MMGHEVLRKRKIEVLTKIEVEKDLTAQGMKSMVVRRENEIEKFCNIMKDTHVKNKIITHEIDRAMTGDKASNRIRKASISKTIKSRNMAKHQNQAFSIIVIKIQPCNKKDRSTCKSLDHEVGHLVLGKEAHTVRKR